MQNCALIYDLANLTTDPIEFYGHKSSFFTKASIYNDIVACGS